MRTYSCSTAGRAAAWRSRRSRAYNVRGVSLHVGCGVAGVGRLPEVLFERRASAAAQLPAESQQTPQLAEGPGLSGAHRVQDTLQLKDQFGTLGRPEFLHFPAVGSISDAYFRHLTLHSWKAIKLPKALQGPVQKASLLLSVHILVRRCVLPVMPPLFACARSS